MMVTAAPTRQTWRPTIHSELKRFSSLARGQRIRSRVTFARECIVLSEGPHEGEHWRPHFQPYSYHLLNLMDSSGYRKFRFTGCVQSGKTLVGVINVLWHLLERRETLVFGVPEMGTAEDKWMEELLPIIQASQELRQYLPLHGRASDGGFNQRIQFRNGASLRFMSSTGKDHRRSHFTAPVFFGTEVDRYDTAAEISRESSPIEQMNARTEAFGDRAFSYEECTVTTEDGRIWSEYLRGTQTQLHVTCPHCSNVVLPDREHLVGVDDAADIEVAATEGAFCCPHCGVVWSDEDRRSTLHVDRLIPRNCNEGKTDTLSFRWTAFHNKFWTTKKIATDEWQALFSPDPDEADLKRRQFVWTLPAEPDEFSIVPLTINDVYTRGALTRGVVPPGTKWLSLGADVRQTELHYVVRAWSSDEAGIMQGRAIDFDILPVDTQSLGVRDAIITALANLRENIVTRGYRDADGIEYPVNIKMVDAGWMEEVIWSFICDCDEKRIPGWYPIIGRGQSEPPGKGSYSHPTSTNPDGPVLWIGEQFHVRKSTKYKMPFIMANSDEWKSFVHDGYATPEGRNGALTHFDPVTTAEKRLLRTYSRHVVAEERIRKVVPRRGPVEVWIDNSKKPNHFFDCDYYSCVAGYLAGVRIATRERFVVQRNSKKKPITMPDGQPFAVTRREET